MLEPAREAAAAALAGLADDDGTIEAPMSAYVLSARSGVAGQAALARPAAGTLDRRVRRGDLHA
jgi:hypothetical protein